jgi:hypothetical protein
VAHILERKEISLTPSVLKTKRIGYKVASASFDLAFSV